MSCSFHAPEQMISEVLQPMPGRVPPPTSLALETPDAVDNSFEVRCTPPEKDDPNEEARTPGQLWVRVRGPLPDDPVLHDCLLFYASDLGTPWNVEAPQKLRVLVSLDHAVWMHHRPVRMDDWHYMDLRPGALVDARGFYTGNIWNHDGAHVASIAQENLLRPLRSSL